MDNPTINHVCEWRAPNRGPHQKPMILQMNLNMVLISVDKVWVNITPMHASTSRSMLEHNSNPQLDSTHTLHLILMFKGN